MISSPSFIYYYEISMVHKIVGGYIVVKRAIGNVNSSMSKATLLKMRLRGNELS